MARKCWALGPHLAMPDGDGVSESAPARQPSKGFVYQSSERWCGWLGILGCKPQHTILAKRLKTEFTGRLQGATDSAGGRAGGEVSGSLNKPGSGS